MHGHICSAERVSFQQGGHRSCWQAAAFVQVSAGIRVYAVCMSVMQKQWGLDVASLPAASGILYILICFL